MSWLVCALLLAACSPSQAAPTFIPLATNHVVPAVHESDAVGLGILDFQGSSVGYAVTVSNLSSILAVDISLVSCVSPSTSHDAWSAVCAPKWQSCAWQHAKEHHASDCSAYGCTRDGPIPLPITTSCLMSFALFCSDASPWIRT